MKVPASVLASIALLVSVGCGEEERRRSRGYQHVSNLPGAICDDVANWELSWVALEAEVVQLVNAERARGADCRTAGTFGPAPAVSVVDNLRCSARKHAKDMGERDYFDHDNPEGEGPGVRITAAGYKHAGWGENIAAGSSTAADVMANWMSSDGHCRNIMNPSYAHLGVGYYYIGSGFRHYWVQNFGIPGS